MVMMMCVVVAGRAGGCGIEGMHARVERRHAFPTLHAVSYRRPPATAARRPPPRAHLPLQLRALALQRRLFSRQRRELLLQAVRDVLLLRLEAVF